MQRKTNLFFFFIIATALFLFRCANPVSPDGGPKDLKPPSVIACDPPNFAVNFMGNSFRIDFDEFINLKNPSTEVFISPPLKTPLEPRLRGKSLMMKFEDSLVKNITYSITFGNAITDFTENNILKGFNYVFATGAFVDTLSLQGNIINAFDHKPQKDVFVELYINNNDTLPFDSLPLHVPPYYLTKTDDKGNFIFNNLQDKQFKLVALSDQNGDLIFNQANEKIAFYDSLVKPFYILRKTADTSRKDSALITPAKNVKSKVENPDVLRKADSTRKADSIKQYRLLYPSYPLFLFEETDSIQRLVRSTSQNEGMALFTFRFPANNIRFVPLNFDSVAPWYVEEYSRRRDSVSLWITRPKTDSLILKVLAGNKVLDTVMLDITKKDIQKKSEKKEKTNQLALTSSIKGSGLNQFKNDFVLTFSCPLIRWDFTRVSLIENKDTIYPKIEFFDSLKRKIVVHHKWLEEKGYKIIIPDSVFYGINNISHDSILMDFRTRAERDFGNFILSMNIDKRPGQYIIQLIDEKESTIYEEHIVTQSGKIHFNFMPPGKYRIKAIFDRNKNMRWDTGNYKKNLQPEEVLYFSKIIEIRSNWDVEETWD
ncbi:MAG: Ig-like domain-containing protein [Bacteroidota bacterium]